MFYALLDDKKIEPAPQQKAKCPCCGKDVISRCGELNIWHWAHIVDVNCDKWYEPETEWHRNWKKIFGKESSEVIFNRDNLKHIADIFTNDNIVIELQNSPINVDTIRARESFYGEKMIWVINAQPFSQNLVITKKDPRRMITYPSNPAFSNEFNLYIKQFQEDIEKYKQDERIKYFSWNYPRKSWKVAQKPTFIDYSEDNLFFVKVGLGTRYGYGLDIPKKTFISKYKR